jgi:hypothetical protein
MQKERQRNMSQQALEFEGIHRDGPGSTYNRYNDYSTAFQGQKISVGRASSPGQRLVIALVSLVLLALMTFGVIGIGFLANVGLTGGFLFLILLVCFYAAVVIINVVFNRGGYM